MQQGWRNAALALVAAGMLASRAFAQTGVYQGAMGTLYTLRMPAVQIELKLTDEQKTKVLDLVNQFAREGEAQSQKFRTFSDKEREKRVAERRAEEDQKLGGILTPGQMKRYQQLRLQQRGMAAVLDPPIAEQLKLTEEQQTKIGTIVAEQREALRGMYLSGGFELSKLATLHHQIEGKIAAVLTDNQKKRWNELVGAPFTFPAPSAAG
jgi:Spy/CpxP family protein refolding chaperone